MTEITQGPAAKPTILKTVIVATKYCGDDGGKVAVQTCLRLIEGDEIELRRDPTNPADKNAVLCVHRGQPVGFIPARMNGALAKAMDAGIIPTAAITAAPISVGGGIREVPKLRIEWVPNSSTKESAP